MQFARKYSDDGGSREKPPAGFYVAALAAVFDIGRQEKDYAGEKKVMNQVILVWELDKRDTKGRRFTVNEFVTASTHEKAVLTKRVAALLGRAPTTDTEFDTDLLVGRSVYLMLKPPSKADGWPRVDTVTPLPPGFTAIKPEFKPDPVPKYVENARAKAVGGWKAPTPTPTNKSAVAGTQGPSQATREPGDDTDEIAREKAGGPPPF